MKKERSGGAFIFKRRRTGSRHGTWPRSRPALVPAATTGCSPAVCSTCTTEAAIGPSQIRSGSAPPPGTSNPSRPWLDFGHREAPLNSAWCDGTWSSRSPSAPPPAGPSRCTGARQPKPEWLSLSLNSEIRIATWRTSGGLAPP